MPPRDLLREDPASLEEVITAIKNGTVRGFNLNRYTIGNAGAIALATALQTNETLEYLYLNTTGIGNSGVIALATALETNARLTDLSFSGDLIGGACAEALARIATLLRRNKIFKKSAFLKQRLAVDVTYQSEDPTQRYSVANKSKQPYFDASQMFSEFHFIHQDIRQLARRIPRPSFHTVKKVINDWLALVILFHLRCVDTLNDTGPISNNHPQVAAAERCLAQMDVDSEGYKEACYQLGRYYYTRATRCFDIEEDDQGNAFAKTALNYLHVCKQDPNFKEAETQGLIYDDSELPFLITSLISILLSPTAEISVKTAVKDFTTYMPDKENYDRALNLEVPDAKTVPAKINYNEVAIMYSLRATAITAAAIAAFYRLHKLLDKELLRVNTFVPQPDSSPSNNASGFFKMSGSVSQQQMQQAIQAVKDALTGNRVEGNFADHVIVLKNTAVIDKLNLFIAAGHAQVGDKKVETLEEFVMEVMKKNVPEPGQR